MSSSFTSSTYWVDVGFSLHSVLWLAINGCLLLSAIWFFRADRRIHTGVLLGGAILKLCVAAWHELRWRLMDPGSLDQDYVEVAANEFLLSSGLSLLGEVMVAYGLIAVAWIQLRRSRVPPVGDQ